MNAGLRIRKDTLHEPGSDHWLPSTRSPAWPERPAEVTAG